MTRVADEFQDFAARAHHRPGRHIEISIEKRDVIVERQLRDQP